MFDALYQLHNLPVNFKSNSIALMKNHIYSGDQDSFWVILFHGLAVGCRLQRTRHLWNPKKESMFMQSFLKVHFDMCADNTLCLICHRFLVRNYWCWTEERMSSTCWKSWYSVSFQKHESPLIKYVVVSLLGLNVRDITRTVVENIRNIEQVPFGL